MIDSCASPDRYPGSTRALILFESTGRGLRRQSSCRRLLSPATPDGPMPRSHFHSYLSLSFGYLVGQISFLLIENGSYSKPDCFPFSRSSRKLRKGSNCGADRASSGFAVDAGGGCVCCFGSLPSSPKPRDVDPKLGIWNLQSIEPCGLPNFSEFHSLR